MTYEERSKQIAKKMMMLHGHSFKDPVGQKQDIIDSCMEMAQFVEEQLIEKTCKFLKSYRQDTPDGFGYIAGVVNDKTIDDFKKYMEE